MFLMMRRKKFLLKAARVAFGQVLRRLGVGGLAANVASYFVFRHIVRPIMHHYMRKKILKSYSFVHPEHHEADVWLSRGGKIKTKYATKHFKNGRKR